MSVRCSDSLKYWKENVVAALGWGWWEETAAAATARAALLKAKCSILSVPSSGENIKSLMFLGGSTIQAVEGWESWAVLLARCDLERVSTGLGWAPPSLLPSLGWDLGVQLPWDTRSCCCRAGPASARPPSPKLPKPGLALPSPPWEPVLINPLLMPRGCCWRLVLNAKLLPDGAFGFLGRAGSRFFPPLLVPVPR